MTAQGVPRFDAESTGLSFGWYRTDLEDDDCVGSYGRAFDIIVLRRPSDQPNHLRLPSVEAALFDSGRPVVLVPPVPLANLGRTVVIAWNRSTVVLAMPLLAEAQRIVVIDFDDWDVSGPSTRDLSHTLARNGLPVVTRTVPNPHGHASEAILLAAGSLNCDQQVNGAYTQSRLRQFIFGGGDQPHSGEYESPRGQPRHDHDARVPNRGGHAQGASIRAVRKVLDSLRSLGVTAQVFLVERSPFTPEPIPA